MIRIDQSQLPVVALSHPGMSGKNNEDRFAVSAFQIDEKNTDPILFAIVSDGIGGHAAGEIAAEIAVNLISQRVAESNASQPVTTLVSAVEEASREIYARSQADSAQSGMGATCCCVWIIQNHLYTVTVGDSRIYLLRGDHIRQINIDHTWIQEALEKGVLKPDQVRGHPNAHVIRRYLGSPQPPQVDFRLRLNRFENDAQSETNQGTSLYPGDHLLLCSDGLTDLVEAPEILKAFHEHPQEEAAQFLIELANQRGGHDNITIISIEVPAQQAESKRTSSPWRALGLGCLGLFMVSALAAALVMGYLWYNDTFRGEVTPAPNTESTLALPGLKPGNAAPTQPSSTRAAPQATQTVQPPVSTPAGAATITPWPTNTPPK
jgi:protein phosphatase